jgi:hypothetical protein
MVAEKGPVTFTLTTNESVWPLAEALQQQWSRLKGVTVNV